MKEIQTSSFKPQNKMPNNTENNKDFYFYLTDLQAIDANGSTVKINATLPLQGNIMRIAESSVIYKPDLIISGVTYSKRTDGLYDVKATVKNTGDAEAKGSFKVMAYQSSVHNYYKMVPADAVIVAGGYSEISFTLEAGGYVFMADYDNIILEKDENNNNWESNIAGADSTINSPITVLSPNGGEQLVQGQTSRIAWRGGNYPVQVAVVRSTFPADLTVAGDISLQANPDGYIDWDTSIISSRSPNGKRWIDPGQYKIVVYAKSPEDFYCFDSTDPSVCTYDVSDASFSVAAASITLAPSPVPVSSPTPSLVPSDCLPDNTLVKMPDDPKVYVIINCQKKWIQTVKEFKEEGYNWSAVKEVNSPVIQAYADYQQATANLLQAIGQQKVYRVVNNKVLWIPTIAAFNAQGLKWSGIQSVNESDLVKYPRAKLVQVAGDPKVYYITESGLKKHIANETVFDSYNNKWSDVVTVDVAIVNSYPDANLIKAEDGYQVYKIENGQKRWIKTDAAFRRLKLDWNKVAPVNNTELAAYPDGAVIE